LSQAQRLLEDNRALLERLVRTLLDQETVERKELSDLLGPGSAGTVEDQPGFLLA